MIQFACPHCGNPFRIPDKFAGQYGWCRACKGMVYVPREGESPTLDGLTAEQKAAHLEQALRYLGLRFERGAALLREKDGEIQKLKKKSERYGELSKERDTLRARIEEMEAQIQRLTQELQRVSEDKGRLEARIAGFGEEKASLSFSPDALRLSAEPERAEAAPPAIGAPALAALDALREAQSRQTAMLNDLVSRLERLDQEPSGERALELSRAQAQAEIFKRERDDFERRAADAEARLERLQEELKATPANSPEAETRAVQAALELDKAREALDAERQLRLRWEAEREALHERLRVLDEDRSARREELTALHARLRELEKAALERAALEARLAEAREQTERLMKELAARAEAPSPVSAAAEPAGSEDEGEGVTFIPEVVDEEDEQIRDPMADALFRFIGPE